MILVCDAVVNVPSIFPKAALPNVPEKTSELFDAAVKYLNFASVSSIPKKPTLATPSLYLNSIPRSLLSSEAFCPKTKTGSAIETVVELTVVVVPDTVKFPAIVTLSGKPIVTCAVSAPLPETSISTIVPAIDETSAPVVFVQSATALF